MLSRCFAILLAFRKLVFAYSPLHLLPGYGMIGLFVCFVTLMSNSHINYPLLLCRGQLWAFAFLRSRVLFAYPQVNVAVVLFQLFSHFSVGTADATTQSST